MLFWSCATRSSALMAIFISGPRPFRGCCFMTSLWLARVASNSSSSSSVCKIAWLPKVPVGTGALNFRSLVAIVALVPFFIKSNTSRNLIYWSLGSSPCWFARVAEKHISKEMACPCSNGGDTANSKTGDQVCPKYITRSRHCSRQFGTSTSRTDWIAGREIRCKHSSSCSRNV